MSTDAEVRGLCKTCVHASNCTFPRDPDRPVTQCEEYESVASQADVSRLGMADTRDLPSSARSEDYS